MEAFLRLATIVGSSTSLKFEATCETDKKAPVWKSANFDAVLYDINISSELRYLNRSAL